MRHAKSEALAKEAAEYLRHYLGISGEQPPVGIVLGTGWGDALALEKPREVSFEEIPGFKDLGALEGHARRVVFGLLNGQPVIALRGRVHLNEHPNDPEVPKWVRLQAEMLMQLGVKTLILTCAAGSLQSWVKVGHIVVIDGFVTAFAPPMPLFAGEFCSPEDTIDHELMDTFLARASSNCPGMVFARGGHVMLRGPFFEGRKYDKRILRCLDGGHGNIVSVGMSVLPEACIAALYGAKTIPLAFITNSDSEEHSHEENQRRAKLQSLHMGTLLGQIVSLIASNTH